ncbi:MAG: hypothetical protein LBH63_04180 [Clostridiales Family XIII bacterium]|nr:hypothetical protein [Clostridiales Family XIII bacterium]
MPDPEQWQFAATRSSAVDWQCVAGIGITEDQQANLFTSFQQAENSTSRKVGGTGLGLAISKRIAEMMDGRINLNAVSCRNRFLKRAGMRP